MPRSRRIRLPCETGQHRAAPFGAPHVAPPLGTQPSAHEMAPMTTKEPVNILLVDDQPAKLLSYQTILEELGERLITVGSGAEALERLLKTDVAVMLIDVIMP